MRYINLFCKYFSLNIKGLKSYGTDFYIGIFAMMIKNISSLFMLFFLYTLVPKLDGWSFYELLHLYSLSTMGFAMWRSLFMNTLNISYYVRNGILERFLVKPVNPLFQIFMEGFDDDAWGDLIIGILINIICIYQLKLSWYTLIFSIILSFFGSLIFASFSILGSIISLKTVGVSDFSDIPYLIYEFMKYPVTIYGNVLVAIFTYILPVAWISFIPSHIFIENNFLNSLIILLISIGVSLIFFCISCLVFLNYLKSYTSTGT
ncbi:ABC transporter permease [Streptobacillus moniliformis]|uniref:ABC transporter permease n=1 Tax=Streptobacillus moniliformis TaxID=34105 RepID=UPI0007E40A0F|nr:ABC-2 family transporter protein [Streptobacillus moniliformis]